MDIRKRKEDKRNATLARFEMEGKDL